MQGRVEEEKEDFREDFKSNCRALQFFREGCSVGGKVVWTWTTSRMIIGVDGII